MEQEKKEQTAENTGAVDKILEETKKRPLYGFLMALLITVSTLAGVTGYLYKDNNDTLKKDNKECSANVTVLQSQLKQMQDSFRVDNLRHTQEVIDIINKYNDDLKTRAEKQEAINQKLQEVLVNKNKETGK